jgi:hypothetical protein
MMDGRRGGCLLNRQHRPEVTQPPQRESRPTSTTALIASNNHMNPPSGEATSTRR